MARRRRHRFRTEPISGIRYEKGSLMDMGIKAEKGIHDSFRAIGNRNRQKHYQPDYHSRDNYYKQPYHPKYHRRRFRSGGYREEGLDLNDVPDWVWYAILIIGLAVMFWIYVIYPAILWAQQNWIPVLLVSVIVFFVVAFILTKIWKLKKLKEFKKRVYEEEQNSKGLVKFVDRFGNEQWVKSNEIEALKKHDEEEREKETLLFKVIESIKRFQPSRTYGNEYGYHTELQGWLKSNFSSAKVEFQTGASRPDIVIDDIAIEVKGPTDNQALNTLTTKCLKYGSHYPHLILVLFEPTFSESNYYEILEGIKRHFPTVEVIRK